MDGANITFEKGLDVPHSSHLHIYSQSYNSAMGKLYATGEDEAAGIGANKDHISGDITIHGGDITAQGGDYGAGIGGGDEVDSGSGNITIYDGTIHATGGSLAAGIGSGDGNNISGTVTFNFYGGYIVAQGGQDGADIGGGEGVSCGIINIYGGTIRATGGEYGAGIGDGELGIGTMIYQMFDPGHSITIYGGDIRAKGGTYGAGIGGYNLPTTSQVDKTIEITIYDGQVSAIGGRYGAGIGGSQNGNGANVTIHGDTVIADGGDDAAGIGSGEESNLFNTFFRPTHGGTLNFSNEEMTFDYLHLIDNLTGNDIDLLASPSYTFEAKSDDYASRFKLMFSAVDNDNENDDFAFISNGNLIVNSTGILQVIDVLGRQCYAKELSTDNCQLPIVNLPAGVYVLHLINGNNVKTQKIIIK